MPSSPAVAPSSAPHDPHLTSALEYARRGLAVLPLHGKVPLTEHGVHDATTDEATILAWWTRWPNANIGLATGRELPDGGFLVAVDVDPRHGGDLELARFLDRHNAEMGQTRAHATGGGGAHFFFRVRTSEPMPGFVIARGPDGKSKAVELKGEAGYVVAPPSIHPETGERYTVDGDTLEILDAPDWLYTAYLDAATRKGQATLAVPMPKDDPRYPSRLEKGKLACQRMPAQADGTGGKPLFNLALRLVRTFELHDDDAHTLIVEHFNPRATDKNGAPWPWSDDEIQHKLEDARTKGKTPCGLDEDIAAKARAIMRAKSDRASFPEVAELRDRVQSSNPPPPDRPLTDLGNAERFADQHRDVARYVGAWSCWMIWDGRRWQRDACNRIALLAKQTARSIDEEVRHAGSEERRANLRKHATRSESRAGIENMVALARGELAAAPEDFDRDPWLFNVANGTLDLRTGQLHPHRREDMLTKLSPVEYDPTATCPRWDAFLSWAMGGDAELIAFLRRAAGYALVGVTTEHAMFFSYGDGENGKGVFHNTLVNAFGEYASKAPRGLLFESKNERHPAELADLFGARFVLCGEVKQGQRFDEALIKDLVGEDRIKARRMHENFWQFTPTHTLFICGNHKPVVQGNDHGIWRRIRLIPWLAKVDPKQKDRGLVDKLRSELPGVLAWAIRGCLEWQRAGLGEPAPVEQATAAYRAESNPLHDFFEARCSFDPSAKVSRAELRRAYEAWAREVGAEPLGARRFADALKARGVVDGGTVRVSKGAAPVNAWQGVRLL